MYICLYLTESHLRNNTKNVYNEFLSKTNFVITLLQYW